MARYRTVVGISKSTKGLGLLVAQSGTVYVQLEILFILGSHGAAFYECTKEQLYLYLIKKNIFVCPLSTFFILELNTLFFDM